MCRSKPPVLFAPRCRQVKCRWQALPYSVHQSPITTNTQHPCQPNTAANCCATSRDRAATLKRGQHAPFLCPPILNGCCYSISGGRDYMTYVVTLLNPIPQAAPSSVPLFELKSQCCCTNSRTLERQSGRTHLPVASLRAVLLCNSTPHSIVLITSKSHHN